MFNNDCTLEESEDIFADDGGGAGSVGNLSLSNPLESAKPSSSLERRFSFSAVAVDSGPCSVVGR